MSKQKNKPVTSQGRGPLARKLLSKSRDLMRRKVVDLGAWREGRRVAEEIDASLIAEDQLGELDPMHGLFAFAQHRLSAFVEQLSALPELRKLTDALVQAEDEYMPSGPPMSPLTQSYFFCWGALDLSAGPKRESFASIAIDLCRQFDLDPYFIQLLSAIEQTRMGVYIHQGHRAGRIRLRELVTGRQHEVICPAGYSGAENEVWYVRLFHWPFETEGPGYSVVINTPYVIVPIGPSDKGAPKLGTASDWEAYFNRTLPRSGPDDEQTRYNEFMKYGEGKNYWNEYVFLAYVNHREDVIWLTGIPDRPESLPHAG